MKKVLVGVGIGCGTLVLLGVVGAVVTGVWVKGKVEETTGNLQTASERAELAQKRATTLNEKYAFALPAKGIPVSLAEGRLQQYLAVRTALQPIYKVYAQRSEELKRSAGDKPGVGDALRAMDQLTGFLTDLRVTWLDQLDGKKMSPREYHAITAALYTSTWGAAMSDVRAQQRPMLEQMKAALEQQLSSARDAQTKKLLEEQLASMERQLAELPPAGTGPTEAERVHKANQVLYAKYKQQIEEQAQQGLDILLLGDGEGSSLGDAFEHLGGGNAPSADDTAPGEDGE